MMINGKELNRKGNRHLLWPPSVGQKNRQHARWKSTRIMTRRAPRKAKVASRGAKVLRELRDPHHEMVVGHLGRVLQTHMLMAV